MILLYPIGIPALFIAVLLKRQNKINPPSPTPIGENPSLSANISSDTAIGTARGSGEPTLSAMISSDTAIEAASGRGDQGDPPLAATISSDTAIETFRGSGDVVAQPDGRRAALAFRVNAAMEREEVRKIFSREASLSLMRLIRTSTRYTFGNK